MGDGQVRTEMSESMEESQSSGADKIDMSLDDIIKLNKKEQKANRAAFRARNKRAANKNNVLKKLSQAPQTRRGIRRGTLQYQGPSRSRGLNRARGLSRRGSLRGSGLSPLNRASASTATPEQLGQNTAPQRGAFRGRGRGRGRGGLNRGAFSARGQRAPQRGGRAFTLDRGFVATRGAGKLERYQKIRSRTTASSSGTTLTVSLPNAKSAAAAPPKRGGAMLRGRSSEDAGSATPKGIQLRFNYKATTNQTGLSLHDRFTSLRIRGRGRRAERGSGRGRGRGQIRGRGRGGERGRGERGRGMLRGGMATAQGGRGRGGRGRAAARGAGRMVILQ
ncbi:spidroin-1 [Colossoma macropomum]|uniref:spidroin-1 n=1 Tax=Colossoma macropomum TaxID=42526 RepID=UPI0018654563|nr:spidroin-1 [Colossoma macropomum]